VSKPGCTNYCTGTLQGIVDNLKLRGKISEEFELSVEPMRNLMWVPGGSYTMTCPHGRKFLVKQVRSKEKK